MDYEAALEVMTEVDIETYLKVQDWAFIEALSNSPEGKKFGTPAAVAAIKTLSDDRRNREKIYDAWRNKINYLKAEVRSLKAKLRRNEKKILKANEMNLTSKEHRRSIKAVQSDYERRLNVLAQHIRRQDKAIEQQRKVIEKTKNKKSKKSAEEARAIAINAAPAKKYAPPHKEEAILAAVCQVFGVSMDQLLGRSRKRNVARARHLATWMLWGMIGYTTVHAAQATGRDDHTSAINSLKRVEENWKLYGPYLSAARGIIDELD